MVPNDLEIEPTENASSSDIEYYKQLMDKLKNTQVKPSEMEPYVIPNEEELNNISPTNQSPITSSQPISIPPVLPIQQMPESLGSVDRLREIQDQANKAALVNRLGRSAEIIGTGISGAASGGMSIPKPVAQEIFEENAKAAQQPVQNYLQQVEMEKKDPKSAISKSYQDIMKQFGAKVPSNLSAESIGQIAPWVEKKYIADEARKEKAADLKYKYEQLKELAKMRLSSAQEAKNNAQTVKQEKETHDRFDKMGKALTSEIASSRSSFGRGANIIRSSEAIEQLVGNSDPNNLDNRQITEIARNLDAMLSQGQATISGMNKLIPKSYSGDASKIKEYLSGLPQGAGQGEFVKRMIETIKREKELAKDQVQRTQGKLLAPYIDLKDKDPNKWNTIFEQHGLPSDILESKGKISKPSSSSSKGTVSKNLLQQYIQKHNVDETTAVKTLKDSGYNVEGY